MGREESWYDKVDEVGGMGFCEETIGVRQEGREALAYIDSRKLVSERERIML